ncbi:hypothetical protein [Geofilum rubicundum]|uniref:hypothetical protein n=1 Tax=Geofilum rubicundum TaxID=472113 RepID=UPI00138E3239|nr:hypothetical protein [Geofilum rubicundum]
MKRALLSLFLILTGFLATFAQIDFGNLEEEQIYRPDSTYNTWSISVGYGPVIYYTDVIDYTLFPSSQLKLVLLFRYPSSWGVRGPWRESLLWRICTDKSTIAILKGTFGKLL